MTKKELNVIKKALTHAKEVIQDLACENYPRTPFEDPELRDMFYRLDDMCTTMNRKMVQHILDITVDIQ